MVGSNGNHEMHRRDKVWGKRDGTTKYTQKHGEDGLADGGTCETCETSGTYSPIPPVSLVPSVPQCQPSAKKTACICGGYMVLYALFHLNRAER